MEEVRTNHESLVSPEIERHRRLAMAAILAGLLAMNLLAWLLYR